MLDIKTEGEERPELYVSKRYYFFINHSLFTWGDFFSYYCLICFAINSFIKFIIILLTYMLKFSSFIFGSFQLFKVITFYSDPYWSYNIFLCRGNNEMFFLLNFLPFMICWFQRSMFIVSYFWLHHFVIQSCIIFIIYFYIFWIFGSFQLF